jgi:hypothetical protein
MKVGDKVRVVSGLYKDDIGTIKEVYPESIQKSFGYNYNVDFGNNFDVAYKENEIEVIKQEVTLTFMGSGRVEIEEDKEEGSFKHVALFLATNDTKEEMTKAALEYCFQNFNISPEGRRCQHVYDCCGGLYHSAPSVIIDNVYIVVITSYYLNI